MSKGSEWIPLDKYLSQEFVSIKREFSMIEAMFSYTLDRDKGYFGTISGYSKLWRWSRNKVRRFLEGIGTDEGHVRDRKRTHDGHPIHFIDKGLWSKKDSTRTGEGQEEDTKHDTTYNPKSNPKKETKRIPRKNDFGEDEKVYITKNKKRLTGKRLESFEVFWEKFNYKKGKASAADEWFKIPVLQNSILENIYSSAESEASHRTEQIQLGKTPIYAQGWISGRRWEDEQSSGQETMAQYLKRKGIKDE